MSFKIAGTEYFRKGEIVDNTIKKGDYFTIEWNGNPLGCLSTDLEDSTPTLKNTMTLDMTYGDGLTGRYSDYADTLYHIMYLYTENVNGLRENTDLVLNFKYYNDSNNWDNGVLNVYHYVVAGINRSIPWSSKKKSDDNTITFPIRITSNMKDLNSVKPIDTSKKYFIYSTDSSHNPVRNHFWKYWKENKQTGAEPLNADIYSTYYNNGQWDEQTIQLSVKKIKTLPTLPQPQTS